MWWLGFVLVAQHECSAQHYHDCGLDLSVVWCQVQQRHFLCSQIQCNKSNESNRRMSLLCSVLLWPPLELCTVASEAWSLQLVLVWQLWRDAVKKHNKFKRSMLTTCCHCSGEEEGTVADFSRWGRWAEEEEERQVSWWRWCCQVREEKEEWQDSRGRWKRKEEEEKEGQGRWWVIICEQSFCSMIRYASADAATVLYIYIFTIQYSQYTFHNVCAYAKCSLVYEQQWWTAFTVML